MPAATIARMNRLDTEHQRLFASDPDATAEGRLRHLVLALSGPADWTPLSAVWRGVQADLDLPAPAIAVNGVDAFELWFSLADPVPIHTAAAFLDGLCDRYLGDVAPARRRCWPSSDPGLQVEPSRVPQLQEVAALGGQGQADQAAAEAGHEVDGLGRDLVSGNDHIAFVFAVLVVDEHDHAAGRDVGHEFGDGGELEFGHGFGRRG